MTRKRAKFSLCLTIPLLLIELMLFVHHIGQNAFIMGLNGLTVVAVLVVIVCNLRTIREKERDGES
jgi:uncharacterized membrane protein